MENKFGRVKAFVDELEKVELVDNEEALLLLQTGGDSFYGTGNNCQCNGNNCSCNTVLGCGSGAGSGSNGSGC